MAAVARCFGACARLVISTSFQCSFVTDFASFQRRQFLHGSGITDADGRDFLSEASIAVVLEDGAATFDLAQAKYSISGEYNKCLLHLWSAEGNTVRRLLDAEVKSGRLRLAVMKLGQTRPTKLKICRERDRRSPSAKRAAHVAYEAKLRRAIERGRSA